MDPVALTLMMMQRKKRQKSRKEKKIRRGAPKLSTPQDEVGVVLLRIVPFNQILDSQPVPLTLRTHIGKLDRASET